MAGRSVKSIMQSQGEKSYRALFFANMALGRVSTAAKVAAKAKRAGEDVARWRSLSGLSGFHSLARALADGLVAREQGGQ